jgi:hypothetical protein
VMMIFNTDGDRAVGAEGRICGCAGVASGEGGGRGDQQTKRDLRVPESRRY